MQVPCAAIGSEAGSAPEAAGSIRDRSSPEAGAEVGAAGESMQVPCAAAIGSEAGSEAAGSIRDRSSPEASAEVDAAGESMQVPCAAAIRSEAAGSAPEAAGSCGGGRLATDRGGLGGSRVGGGGG